MDGVYRIRPCPGRRYGAWHCAGKNRCEDRAGHIAYRRLCEVGRAVQLSLAAAGQDGLLRDARWAAHERPGGSGSSMRRYPSLVIAL